MAKKAHAKKAPAKRKPRAKKPVPIGLPDGQYNAVVWNPELEMYVVTPLPRDGEKAVIDQAIKETETHLVKPAVKSSSLWRRLLFGGAVVAGLVVSFLGGIYAAGGIEVGPGPVGDVLQQSYDADRITQVAVLRDLAKQPFDGTTDDGRKQAGEWFNAQRFRNRANDFGVYTDRVAEVIAGNSEDKLAEQLEAK